MGAPGLALETWETTSGYYYPSAQYGCWSYDSFGNRTQELFSSQPVNCAQSPQIVYNANNQAPSSLQYDQAGDVTGDSNSGNSYAYDGEGRICAVGVNISGPTSYTQYVYDAEGVRVAKGSAAGLSCSLSSGFTPSSLYLLGQGGEQVTELSVAGGLATPAHSNVFWGGKLLATYDLPNGGFHIPLTDPLGTKRVQVSGTGMAELNCLSLPYGNDLGNPRVVNCYTPTYGTPAPDATEHHFTGKERDTESGNDYFEARYYGSSMGRFLSPDDGEDQSSSNPQSWNLYSYGRNNPLIGTDDDGNTYNVCDSNGKNCSNIDDKTFEAEQKKDQANGESFANGTLSHTDANGNTVKDGSFTHDPDIAGDPASNIAAMGNIGNRGMSGIKAFAVGSVAIGGCVALCPAAGTAALAAGRGLYYAAMGLLPAVPGALEKLQKLDLSVGEANEIIESPTTQRLVDNANNGNINYIADMGGKLIRITTDPTGQRIISAGRVQANGIANGIANGRFTK